MRSSSIVVAGAIVLACAGSAQAAPKNTAAPKAAAGETTRYFIIRDLLDGLETDAILKERRQGGRILSADLDVCHTIAASSPRHDRFVMSLKVEGNRLTGVAQSQEEKLPVVVAITQKPAPDNKFTFEGTVKRGGKSIKAESTDNSDMSETEYAEAQTPDEPLTDDPKDFTEISPQSVDIRVSRAGLAGLVAVLREQNVRLSRGSFNVDCNVLRKGNHVVSLQIDPERAAALLAKAKSMPEAVAAGYSGAANQNRAVRFAGARWRGAGGKLDRNKLAATLAAAAAKVYGGQSLASAWDDTIGQLSLKLKRPARSAPALGLTEIITVSILVGPEAPRSNERLVLWVQSTDADLVDEGSAPRLSFIKDEGEGATEPEDSDSLAAGIAAELRGEAWDSEKSDWSPPQ